MFFYLITCIRVTINKKISPENIFTYHIASIKMKAVWNITAEEMNNYLIHDLMLTVSNNEVIHLKKIWDVQNRYCQKICIKGNTPVIYLEHIVSSSVI